MKMYAFRTTHNLMHGTVFATRFKWAAKRWAKLDPPNNRMNWLDVISGLLIVEIGCDGYLAESGKHNEYPKPNEIIEYEYQK